MISFSKDWTIEFNANHYVVLDVSDWHNVTVQFVSPSGAVNFTGTNDSGGAIGVTDGGPATATNFTTLQMVNLADGTTATATSTSTATFRIVNPPKYIKLDGTSGSRTATKVIVALQKP